VECGSCVRKCPTGVKPHQQFDSPECIMCLKCLDACQFRALSFGVRRLNHRQPKRTVSPL
jgi:ferredoxin-type protein NapH